MKRSIQIKIDKLIALSKKAKSSVQVVQKESVGVPDSLSTAIRSEKDAEVFRQELRSAFRAAANKK